MRVIQTKPLPDGVFSSKYRDFLVPGWVAEVEDYDIDSVGVEGKVLLLNDNEYEINFPAECFEPYLDVLLNVLKL